MMNKPLLRFLKSLSAVLASLLVTSGCVALAVHQYGIEDGNTKYSEVKKSLAPLEPGRGRLFVYLSGGGPSATWAIGIGPAMNGFFTIENSAYAYLGGSYFFVELPAGNHTVTAGKVNFDAEDVGRGPNVVVVDLVSGQESYVRLDLSRIGAGTTAVPVVVDQKVAEKQIAALPMAKDRTVKGKIKK